MSASDSDIAVCVLLSWHASTRLSPQARRETGRLSYLQLQTLSNPPRPPESYSKTLECCVPLIFRALAFDKHFEATQCHEKPDGSLIAAQLTVLLPREKYWWPIRQNLIWLLTSTFKIFEKIRKWLGKDFVPVKIWLDLWLGFDWKIMTGGQKNVTS